MRTGADYEELRRFAVEGGEAHHNLNNSLSLFLAYGAAAWVRVRGGEHETARAKRAKPYTVCREGDLTVLLANMIEI